MTSPILSDIFLDRLLRGSGLLGESLPMCDANLVPARLNTKENNLSRKNGDR